MKSTDQTRGSENTNAKEAETARDQRDPMQSSLEEAWLISIDDSSVTNRWAGASTPGQYQ